MHPKKYWNGMWRKNNLTQKWHLIHCWRLGWWYFLVSSESVSNETNGNFRIGDGRRQAKLAPQFGHFLCFMAKQHKKPKGKNMMASKIPPQVKSSSRTWMNESALLNYQANNYISKGDWLHEHKWLSPRFACRWIRPWLKASLIGRIPFTFLSRISNTRFKISDK